MQAALSPTLEIVAEYLLKVLARAIRFAGTVLLHYREELKEAIALAFQAPSWKVLELGYYFAVAS